MAIAQERLNQVATDVEVAAEMTERLASVLRTYEGIEELFADRAFFDVNIPQFRFQVEKPESFFSWLKGYAPDGYRITVVRSLPTATGFIAEVEGEYERHGHDLFFRNLYICDVDQGRISEVGFWCTGDWDEQDLAHWRAHAPMIRETS